MGGRLIHPDGFPVQLDHVHDFDGVIRVIFREKLDESVALVHQCDSILGHMDINYGTRLDKELPD